MNAESGMEYILYTIKKLELKGEEAESQLLETLAAKITERIQCTISYDDYYLEISPIQMPTGGTAHCSVQVLSGDRALCQSIGEFEGSYRSVSMELEVEEKRATVFDFGIAAKGPIEMSGNVNVIGINDPADASVLSAWNVPGHLSIKMNGNPSVSGDVYAVADASSISLTGAVTVAGESDMTEIMKHVHPNQEDPEFPEIDNEDLKALATNVFSGVVRGGGRRGGAASSTLANIVIPPGTDPTFNSDVELQGVIYIQSPNTIKFNGHATLTGVIVTDDDGDVNSNFMRFNGGFTANSAANLPNTPEFAAVREYEETFILAPSFHIDFRGSMQSDNGMIAADLVTFGGAASGSFRGSLLSLGDYTMDLGGNPTVGIILPDDDKNPDGFAPTFKLEEDPYTYTEGWTVTYGQINYGEDY
jgi:hypothetical protein